MRYVSQVVEWSQLGVYCLKPWLERADAHSINGKDEQADLGKRERDRTS